MKMGLGLVLLTLLGEPCTQALAQSFVPVIHDLPRPYETQRDWGELPEGTAWAAVTAV